MPPSRHPSGRAAEPARHRLGIGCSAGGDRDRARRGGLLRGSPRRPRGRGSCRGWWSYELARPTRRRPPCGGTLAAAVAPPERAPRRGGCRIGTREDGSPDATSTPSTSGAGGSGVAQTTSRGGPVPSGARSGSRWGARRGDAPAASTTAAWSRGWRGTSRSHRRALGVGVSRPSLTTSSGGRPARASPGGG